MRHLIRCCLTTNHNSATMASSAGDRISSSEFKKKKELDEKRKAGTLPPEEDEDGNMINPHNPDFITKRPWYLGASGPSLKHQNVQKHNRVLSMAEADEFYEKGARKKAATKYRKGACENCGAMTHKKKDCVERPRKVGAWKKEVDIKPDEVIMPKYKLDFAGKRDQWVGYNPDEHQLTVKRYQQAEAERQRLRVAALDSKFKTDPDEQHEKHSGKKKSGKKKKKKLAETDAEGEADSSDSDSDTDTDSDSDSDYESDDDDDDKDEFIEKEGGHDAQMSRVEARGTQRKSTVRNLRIREDTAKYLRNLDPNSAYYDPKTRSMRDNPNPGVNPEDLPYAGDNFVRITGEAVKLAKTQLFAWEAYEKGQELHAQANPSQAELLQKRFQEKKQDLDTGKKNSVLEKYGGQKHLQKVPREMLMASSEEYVEYSRDGRVVKGQEKAVVKSKYEEDVSVNNHTAVWGSYFNRRTMTWGFACCHSSTKNSYCTGAAGKEANSAVGQAAAAPVERAMITPRAPEERANEELPSHHANSVYGENLEPELDASKMAAALAKEKEFQRHAREIEKNGESDDRKRKYNSMASQDVTAEEMEAYRQLKGRGDDPMAALMDSDVLLGEDGTAEKVEGGAEAGAKGGDGSDEEKKRKKKKKKSKR